MRGERAEAAAPPAEMMEVFLKKSIIGDFQIGIEQSFGACVFAQDPKRAR
jgi:hypothetical protein